MRKVSTRNRKITRKKALAVLAEDARKMISEAEAIIDDYDARSAAAEVACIGMPSDEQMKRFNEARREYYAKMDSLFAKFKPLMLNFGGADGRPTGVSVYLEGKGVSR